MVRVYLGFHYFHCPLEARENISPAAMSVLFRADHSGDSAPARSHPQGWQSLVCLPAQHFMFMHVPFKKFLNKFLKFCVLIMCSQSLFFNLAFLIPTVVALNENACS